MSYTDGMAKTPGARQHNRGWARLVRDQRREEAVARNKIFVSRKTNSTPEDFTFVGTEAALDHFQFAKMQVSSHDPR